MGTMEFFEELLLTALISVLLAFLVGKFAASAASAAVKPEAVPLARVAGPGMDSDPIEEEEETEKSERKSSSGNGAGSDRPKTGVFEVVEERLLEERPERSDEVSGFDLNRENIADKLFSEVDLTRSEESSSKKEKVDNEVEIGRINDDSRRQQGGSVKGKEDGKKAVEKVVKLGREDAVDKEDGGEVGSLLHGEDEWEGIERSELEMLFGVASEFVGSKKGGDAVSKLSNEVQMQMYGLHKVATEGPCHEPQPMALKVSARAKWNAWQKLGNMDPEAAMGQYISLLNESIPGWTAKKYGEEAKGHVGSDPRVVEASRIDQLDSKFSQSNSEIEVLVEDSSAIEGVADDVNTGVKLSKQVFYMFAVFNWISVDVTGLTKIFLFNLVSPPRVAF
ncbi:acyl-CoA-binding domain-containing protein 3 isoform X1 [Musa acuminata AAA Group]|uniref:acyl-CoA-binding domain-containing protein 3 isoform X1 n=1 Tax=Musa acuminata AAA Group TaxID=214697 RepID=UPI0031E30919